MVRLEIELKRGPMLVRIVGTSKEEIEAVFDDALALLERLEPKVVASSAEQRAWVGDSKLDSFPALKNPKTIREAIAQLMSSDWGKTPRTIGEISEAMKTNAVYYPKGSTSKTLQRMTQVGILRRIKSDQGFKYVRGPSLESP